LTQIEQTALFFGPDAFGPTNGALAPHPAQAGAPIRMARKSLTLGRVGPVPHIQPSRPRGDRCRMKARLPTQSQPKTRKLRPKNWTDAFAL